MTLVLAGDVRPEAAAAALREAGETRIVLAVHRRPTDELLAALRRAGAEPFGVETVLVAGRSAEDAAALVAAARAKLDALPGGERGKARLNAAAVSRRSLFSLCGVLTHAPVAVLDESACAGIAACGICVAGCRQRAIAAGSPHPTIDTAACTACGACVPRCPTGALRLSGASTAQTEAQLERLADMEGVVLACRAASAEAPPGWALVELPTLALVTVGWILQLRARGVDVRATPCADRRCAAVVDVLELAGRVPVGDLAGPVRLGEPHATAGAVAVAGATGVLESEASPLGLVALDEARCTLCGACAVACPVQALEHDDGEDETVLRLRPGACVACGLCVVACPERALAVRRGIDLERLRRRTVELVRAARETCSGCGGKLPPRPLRRRLRERLPELSGAPLDLCAQCAAHSERRRPLDGRPRRE